MGAIATLVTTSLAVSPGEAAECEVRVRNTGSVVDQFTISVVGDVAEWATVEPATLSLFPGAEGTAVVRFTAPRAATTVSGTVHFGVKVESKEDAEGSMVEEGTLDVGAFHDVFAELAPRTSRGKRGARHELALDNRGNARVGAVLSGVDPDTRLAISFSPPAVNADPGTAVFSQVRVQPRKRFLRGPDRTFPFQVIVEPDGSLPLTVDGTFVQQAVVPRWLPRAFLALLLLSALLVGAWLAFLRPQIKSLAKDEVKDQLDAPENRPAISGGGGGGDAGGSTATTVAAAGAGSSAAAAGGTPIDGRLFLTSAGTTDYTVPEDRTLNLTDVVLQNPAGNTGTLQIQRDGVALLVVALENFRDLDYHFVTPIVFTEGQKLQLVATCTSAGCTPGAYFSGTLTGS